MGRLYGPTGVPVITEDQSLLMDSAQMSVLPMIHLARHILNVFTAVPSNG